MAHPTPEGLAQEEGALCVLATKHLSELQKRGVTSAFLTDYAAKLQNMQDAVAAHTGKTSDKKQLTVGELVAKGELLADIRRIQGGAKRTFPKGSPQLKEFYVGDKYNQSTALLGKWATGIAKAWEKYKTDLLAKGNLVQDDLDTMGSNASILQSADSSQENAKRIDAPEATTAALKAMADVEAAADFIYGAAEAEYAKKPEALGEFVALRPLRYAVERHRKPSPPPQAAKS